MPNFSSVPACLEAQAGQSLRNTHMKNRKTAAKPYALHSFAQGQLERGQFLDLGFVPPIAKLEVVRASEDAVLLPVLEANLVYKYYPR